MPEESMRQWHPGFYAVLSLALWCSFPFTGGAAEPRIKTFTLESAGVQFGIPGDWMADADHNLMIAGRPQKGGEAGLAGFTPFFMLFYPTGRKGLVHGRDGLPEIVQGHVDVDSFLENIALELEMENVREAQVASGPTEQQVNGLTQHHMEGTGMYYPSGRGPGTEVNWDLTLVAGARQTMVAVAIGNDLDSHVIGDIYKSIRKD